jgi:hypothetical protein
LQLDFDTLSTGFPPHKSKQILLKRHLDVTLEPVKRLFKRLLEADAGFFEEHHYLDPVLSGPASKLDIV